MAAESNNKYDISNWVKKVVDSCENMDQMNTACRLMYRAFRIMDDSVIQRDLWDYQTAAENKLLDDRIDLLSKKVQILKG